MTAREYIGASIGGLAGAGMAWKTITALHFDTGQAIFVGLMWIVMATYAGHSLAEKP